MEKIPSDFNWNKYVELNKDLSHISNYKDAYNHYINHGRHEKRAYKYKIPKDFNWKTYIFLNEDLLNITDEYTCIRHYCIYGKYESRDYKFFLPMDFDWEEYKRLNPSLSYLNNKKEAINHYVSIGCRQNKKYRISDYENEMLLKLPKPNIIDNNKKYIHYSSKTYKNIHESEIRLTKPFFKIENNLLLRNENFLLNIDKFILIIDFPNGGGGTTFFINTITSIYKKYQTFLITRNINGFIHVFINDEIEIERKYTYNEFIDFLNLKLVCFDKIFINHILDHHTEYLDYLMRIDKQIYYITHDYGSISSTVQPFYYQLDNLLKKYNESKTSLKSPNSITHLLTQHPLNVEIFGNIYKEEIKVIKIPDYKYSLEKHETKNKGIVIGIIGNIIDIKGKNVLEQIQTYYLNNKNVSLVVFGHAKSDICKNKHCYNNINDLNNLLIKFSPNILLELSLWPETWCYTVTLSMLTRLPILYLNKNFPSVVTERLKKYKNAFYFNNLKELDLLIKKYKQNYFFTIDPIIAYEKYWDLIFIDSFMDKLPNEVITRTKFGIKPYFIYFPQYHTFNANNKMFYDNYTDIENLALYNKNHKINFEEPNFDYYNLTKNTDYRLNNTEIIKKQFDLVKYYNYSGFATYYYWFTNNSSSSDNMLMREAIDNLFNCETHLNLFFIWANEDWTNNNAFGNSNGIELNNKYDCASFVKNINNLISYFHHPKYLRIDNKPVLFVYHDYLIDNKSEFVTIANNKCIKSGFAGIHIVFNQFGEYTEKANDDTNKFYINFNYKKNPCRIVENGQIKLDYDSYLNKDKHFNKNYIQTIVWDFNNKARLYKPNRLEHSTECINNTELNKILFTNKIIECYDEEKTNVKRDELGKILLINAFNEWGEKMTFEPSNEYGFYNLNLMKTLLFT